jgi:glutathione synthase/RimK-type ligase-like ATP-grasp enzyme
MKSIALATFHDEPTLFRDEAPLTPALEARAVRAVPTIWNSPEVDWSCYDAVVIRNTWDYHQQAQIFRAWLAHLENLNVPVINPPDLIRWNMDKRYLKTLFEMSIRTVPTIFCEDDTVNLGDILQENQWEHAVMKPVISASGENIWQVRAGSVENEQLRFEWIASHFGAMIQAFMPQISEGEWSLVFFDGDYSHTVLKVPPKGSIFTHEERGATLQVLEPPATMIEQAKNVIEAAQKITGIMPVFARVDGILDEDDFVLMELECVEPELYLSRYEGASERFADVILKRLNI